MQSDHEKGYDRGGMGRRDFLARLGLDAARAAACAGGANAKQPGKPEALPQIQIASDQQELEERRVKDQRHRPKRPGGRGNARSDCRSLATETAGSSAGTRVNKYLPLTKDLP
jgi:hypothetical protein